jgi:hypothetical protein
MLSSATLVAQVAIREKITLNPKPQILKNKGSNRQLSLSDVTSGFIIPKKGMLQVVYENDDRFSSGGLANYLTLNDRLMIDVRHGSTVILDTLLWRFANINVFFNVPCGQYNTKTHYENDAFVPVTFVPVQRGDTVSFYYLTKNNPNGTDTILAISDVIRTWMVDTQVVGWQFDFKSAYNNCAPFEYLQISMYATDTTLKFTKPASDSICPTIPNYNDNLSRRNWIDLELKTTFDSRAMQNVWVRVDTAAIADSGGHSHNGNRPMGKYRIPKISGSGYDTVTTFTRKTDSTGSLKFRFIASQFGGIERIRAKLLSDTTNFDTLRIKIKVDSLYSMPTGDKYVLIGAPDDFDPCNISSSKHYDNHYGTQNLIEAIPKIAAIYDSLHPGIRLRINDMSLKFGGRFDAGNNWSGKHKEHRIGINADIGIRGLSINNQCVDIKKIKLKATIFSKTGIQPKYETSPPHFHIFVKEK